MSQAEKLSPLPEATEGVLEGVSTVFESLGRALVCLDPQFKVVHASPGLDNLLSREAVRAVIGRSAEEIFGAELFGPEGSLRRALEAGEKREGWGATMRLDQSESSLVSITAAPVRHLNPEICHPRVAHVVVIRPGDEDHIGSAAATTLFAGMVARSVQMLRIFRLVEQLAESDATVLITGESGTGKELVARAIHAHSPRRRRPFVAVNCGALPEELLESELFGHVRGAFTGATRDRVGRFELAEQGTLFLDEVGDLPLHLQVKLLRVLQEKSFERVGESTTRSADVRVIAATNRDLRLAVREGGFRDDLYYRLRVVPIQMPPLRERREDIEPLARFLLGRVSRRYDRSLILSPDAMRAILGYHWPGNVRELENSLEYAVAVSRGQTLHPQDLPVEVGGPLAEGAGTSHEVADRRTVRGPSPAGSLSRPTAEVTESHRIRAALDAHRWRRADAAAALGMSRTTLWRKMRELGLLK